MSRTGPARTMDGVTWAMLIALSVLWGGSFFFTGIAVKELPPLTIVLLRVGVAALILQAALPLVGSRIPTDRNSRTAFLGMGMLNNVVPFCLIVWEQTHIASGLAAILNATTPLWGVLVAHRLTTDETLTTPRIVGVLCGLAGVVAMVGLSLLEGLGADLLAQGAVLAAALSYAFAGIYGRRFARMGVQPLVTAAGQVSASTLLLLPIVLVAERPWTLPMPSAAAWGAIAGIAVLSTALAYGLYFRILAKAGATNLLLVTFLIPVSAILLGSLALGERLVTGQLIGMALIGCGLAMIDGRLLRIGRRTLGPEPPGRAASSPAATGGDTT